ncbi:XdhC family protein [Pinirhizobacter sp.]|uniref:XdhC family protein n=1 Tax=Pinirhizobacter sp. TaxID=2950432 RepID=UPI002F41F773
MRERAALVTIIRTEGSTFRRVGAAMLVHETGAIINTLSGGCPERDLVDRAREVMDSGNIRYVGYNEEQGLDLLLEMGCGGTLEVAIEPFNSCDDLQFLPFLEDALQAGRAFMMSTIFPPSGSTDRPRRNFDRRAVDITGGSIPAGTAVCDIRDHGQVVLIESFRAPVCLVIAGASEEARQLADVASRLGWRGTIVDSSSERLGALATLAPGWTSMISHPETIHLNVPLDENTAFVTMTRNLAQDIAYLRAGSDAGAFYLGALGSRERAHLIRARVDSPSLRVPAGLDVGSNTPGEIALAVVAEIMAARHGRTGTSLSVIDGPLH